MRETVIRTSHSREVFLYRAERELEKLKNYRYLEALSETVLIFDGAMGTNLQKLNLTAQDFGGKQYFGCNDVLSLTKPDAVESIHRSFLEVGVDVIETNTFRANRLTLGEFGLAEKIYPINIAATHLAKRIAKSFETSQQPRFVAGSMGPTGKILSIDEGGSRKTPFSYYVDVFKEQALALLEGGVDLLLLETQQDLLEVKAAILGIRKAFQESNIDVPIQVQVTMDAHHHMLFGSSIDAIAAILEPLAIDVIGLNCSTGPAEMETPIEYLCKNIPKPISCLPNAGIPEKKGEEMIYPLRPETFTEQLTRFVEKHGVAVVGGCCGTTAEHLRLLVQSIHAYPIAHKKIEQRGWLSSAFHAYEMRQTPPPFIIGERLNTQGSREFKKIILSADFAQAERLAQQQIENGAHGLDICTALTENDLEKENMVTLIRHLSHTLDAPLVIDTTNPEVMEAALQATPARCLLNSTNFESGEKKARQVFQLAKDYGATILILAIDEQGMAKTVVRKLAIAERAYQLAINEFDLAPQSLVFDPLTFSLASGESDLTDSAVQTLSAIRAIKQKFPQCYTSLGISNVSYGFSKNARKMLNSVFLYHALQAGLDMAILNAGDLIPYAEIPTQERQAAEQLIFENSGQTLAHFIDTFSERTEEFLEKQKITAFPSHPGEKVRWHISHRVRDGLEKDIDVFIQKESEKMSSDEAALKLLNSYLLPAMKEVGDRFSKGEIILPFVLQASEIMRAATIKLEEYLQKQDRVSLGSVLLATVYGDVHDIGKNLVKTILENNGYSVIDLGKQVPAEQIIQVAKEKDVTAIGLSALLVNTSQQMGVVVDKLRSSHSSTPVLIGGAAVNEVFAQKIAKDEQGEEYPGGVFYCKDAFDALRVLSNLKTSQKGKA